MPWLGTPSGPSAGSTTAARPCTTPSRRNISRVRPPQWTRPRHRSGRANRVGLKTRIIPVQRDHPSPVAIEEGARVLRSGGLVVFATETVYGLGADATNPAAVSGIFEAKGRPATNPL